MRTSEPVFPARAIHRPPAVTGGRLPSRIGIALQACLLLFLPGCAMPSSGPSTTRVIDEAGTGPLPLAVVDVQPIVLAAQKKRVPLSIAASLGTGAPRADLRISRGDTVQVSLWEAPPGTLFSSTIVAGQAVSSSGTVSIPPQTVGGDGTVGVPYAGRIRVVDQTPAAVERRIVAALQGKAVQPQALVTVQRSAFNSVTVTGEVAAGARVPLSSGGERILDVIATAGGLRAGVNESVVQLTRGRVTARALFETVVRNASENVYLRPGDIVTVVKEPRTFTALGATGRNAEIPFDAPRISMAEALAKAGGLLDYRADASGVFLFRLETEAVARMLLPPDSPLLGSPSVPIIYRFNLQEPHMLLTMSGFWIEPKDVIYVSNAPGAEVQKFMNMIQGLIYPSLTATSIAVSTR